MIHVVLWLSIAACVSVLVGLGVVLTARPKVPGDWYNTFVAVIALLAIALLIYAWQYICFVYLGGGSAWLDTALFAGIVVTYSALAVLVPLAAIRARRTSPEPREWVLLIGTGAAVALASVFGTRIQAALLRRFVLAARYAILAGAFFWSYGTSFARGGASSAPFYTRFSLFSALAFSIVTVDSVVIRFSLSSEGYVPDGVITLLVYGIAVGIGILRLAARTLRPARADAVVPDSFLQEYGITRREGEIINCLMNGSTNNKIGEQLFISPRTVDNHFSNI